MARVIIVEDERVVARSIAKTLTLHGHEVAACVASGADAIAAAAALAADLVLMDIQLRGPIDGIEAAIRIREASETPVVFLTAFSDPENLERSKAAVPHGYLIKPYSDRELLTTIEVAVHKHRVDRDLREHERWLRTALLSELDALKLRDRREGAAVEASAGTTTAPPARRRHVLVVDDDPVIASIFGRVLEEHHEVAVTHSGREALAAIAVREPDVILCDLMMPAMTGIELHATIAAERPALAERMLFVTGGAFTASVQAFVGAMRERILLKPTRPRELLAAIDRVGA
jgi:CheY-like chemotaxis protein